jgi:hypothetical protein
MAVYKMGLPPLFEQAANEVSELRSSKLGRAEPPELDGYSLMAIA